MSKGFSKLEMATILICAGISIHGIDKNTSINFASLTSQVNYMHNNRDVFDASKYLWEVEHKLAQVNNS